MRKHAFPPNWCLTKLSEVAAPVPNSIVDGPFGSNLKLSDYVEEGIPVLQGKNITNDRFQWFDVRFISELKAKELKRSSVRVGDILLVKIGSIGYSAIIQDLHGFDFAIIPANLAKITPNLDIIDTDYLHRWITSPAAKRYLENSASKTAQPALSLGKIKNLPVPLPPLEEQKRIADILDRAEALRAKRRAALDHLDELTQSIFTEMFGDPVKNPKNWKLEKVQDVISQIEAGWSANGDSRPREENEYAVLKVSAVTQGVFLSEECKVIDNDIEFKKVVTPEKGDVLFSRANTLELVGASCLIRENYPYHLLPDKLWKIRVKEEKICPEYLKFVLSYPTIRHEISKRSTGTSGSMYNISMDKFRLMKITVPPIPLQYEFAHRVEAVEKLKTSHKDSLLELDELFSSLQYRAFRGEL